MPSLPLKQPGAPSRSAQRCLVILLVGVGGMGWGCATVSHEPLPTVGAVDLQRYAGQWYEIARLPMWFQRHCIDSKARYTLLPDGRVGVHNECVMRDGGVESADGVATVVDAESRAKLSVVFDNWFARLVGPSREGNYWILYLDQEYRTALVGTPDRRYLWILARVPALDDAEYAHLVDRARGMGYPVAELIRARRTT